MFKINVVNINEDVHSLNIDAIDKYVFDRCLDVLFLTTQVHTRAGPYNRERTGNRSFQSVIDKKYHCANRGSNALPPTDQ